MAADGRIYVFGGTDGYSNRFAEVEVYDPACNAWTRRADMPIGRWDHAAALGKGGRIYITGGYAPGGYSDTVLAYDPELDSWSTLAPMPTRRGLHASATGPDGRLYVMGGVNPAGIAADDHVYAFDPEKGTWASAPSMPSGRLQFAAITAPDGRIYVFGGGDQAKTLTDVHAYDTSAKTWSTVAPMSVGRSGLAGALGPDGRLYAIGGVSPENFGASAEAYDVSSNAWVSVAPPPASRISAAAAGGLSGYLYVIGGYPEPVGLFAYSPEKESWFLIHPQRGCASRISTWCWVTTTVSKVLSILSRFAIFARCTRSKRSGNDTTLCSDIQAGFCLSRHASVRHRRYAGAEGHAAELQMIRDGLAQARGRAVFTE